MTMITYRIKYFLFFATFYIVNFGFTSFLSAQSVILFNNGATFYTDAAAHLQVNGKFQNDTTIAGNYFIHHGTMVLKGYSTPGSIVLRANSTLRGNGTYKVEQDWINDATFIADSSTVNLYGNTQQYITSNNSTATTFNDLILSGNGSGNNRKKTLLLVDAKIDSSGTLTINDRELETLTNTMFVLNPSPASITNNTILGSEGFVSSSFNNGGSGYLSRITNSTNSYLYPTGSSVITTRYRPVTLTPSSSATNTYTARLGNNDATNDGFNTAVLDTTMCIVNPLFYHEITHSAGSDNATINTFYDPTPDGVWDGMAKWNSGTPNIWNNMGVVTATANIPFNDILKVNWIDFSNSPYILSRQKPETPLLACSLVCANSTGNTFSITDTASAYTWTSPPGTTITSGQNTNTVTVDWNSASGPVTVTTSSVLGCMSNPTSCQVNLLQSPTAQFSSLTLENHYFNFSDLTVGDVAQWSWDFGDGKTSALQNPEHIYFACGSQQICLTVSNSNNCIDSSCTDIIVNELAVIPNVFSPDGDGINDVFFINNTCLNDYSLEIFNRWGMKIFETFLPAGGWDGYTASGIPSPDGTYYYILKTISLTDKDYNKNGFISLLRMK